jgi:hypothetical protein
MEHEAFLKEYGPLMREIFILETLRRKILTYCLTGVWEKGGEFVDEFVMRPPRLSEHACLYACVCVTVQPAA